MSRPPVLGMPEDYNDLTEPERGDYWRQRNALVTKVKAASPGMGAFIEPGYHAPGAAEARAAYRAALDELEEFDRTHGGMPVL